jgi:dTDP-4-amino-4,6-dideoxygalactose transaminase
MIPAHVPPHNVKELLGAAIKAIEDKNSKTRFEEQVKAFIQTENYLSTTSGRRALFLGMKQLGISKGDEVILPAFTSDIVPLVIREVGAVPVPADVELDGYNLDPQSVLSRISRKTKAVLTVHTFGQPSDMKAIGDICKDHHLPVIEDGASAFGARYRNRPIGSFGDIGVLSFGFGKSLSMGGGGGLTAADPKLLEKISESEKNKSSVSLFFRVLGSIILSNPRIYGLIGRRIKDQMIAHEYDHVGEEVVDRTDNPLLAYSLGLLELHSDIIARRRKTAGGYNAIFNRYKGLHPPAELKDTQGTYTRYFLRAEDGDAKNRTLRAMARHGIEPILPDMGYPISKNLYPARWSEEIDNSRTLSRSLIGIPVHKAISNDVLESVLTDARV